MTPKNFLHLALLSAMTMTLANCGKKTKSQDVTISAIPSSPIVFTSAVTVYQNGNAIQLSPPWFKFQVAINNQADEPVEIIGLHLEITGPGAGGAPVTVSTDFDPSSDNSTDVTGTCNYTDFGQFTPGASAVVPVSASTDTNNIGLYEIVDSSSTGSDCHTRMPVFYVTGLPLESASQSSFPYQVKIVPEGYFGTRSNPQDRFQGLSYFYTQ